MITNSLLSRNCSQDSVNSLSKIVIPSYCGNVLSQIADLLNNYNFLTVKHNAVTLLSNEVTYHVMTDNGQVVACAGVIETEPIASIIKHVTVNPAYRHMGYGKEVVETAIQNCSTPYVYCYIRVSNMISIKLFRSLNFVEVRKEDGSGGKLLLMGRRRVH